MQEKIDMSDNYKEIMQEIGKRAKKAYMIMANKSSESKNKALLAIAKSVRDNKDFILSENAKDMEAAKNKGISGAMLDRLELNEQRIEAMANGIEEIVKLDDPVGEVISSWDRPNGLKIARVRVPLGVIGIIYESRPNVTADAGALCLKSGNAAILRGGSESFFSSNAIIKSMHEGLKEAGLPLDAIQMVPTKDREAVGEMLKLSKYIDVIVPRGGKGLCARVQDESKIPTLQHLDGNCHTYVHASADVKMAAEVIKNAKLRRTGICGATESIVIDEAVLNTHLKAVLDALQGCEVRGDERAIKVDDRVLEAKESDWDEEYLASIVSVKTVSGIDEAIDFVNLHSSHHTDAIIASDEEAATKFLNEIDSAIVMHNTSTQFADGGEFGMGAEIGISTGRLHARGPVGAQQLTTFKYVVKGNGQVRP